MDDMVMHHGTPWFDSPVTLNGDRTYKCKFNETWQCDYQTGYWQVTGLLIQTDLPDWL